MDETVVNLTVEDLLKICHKKSPEEVKKINAFAMSIRTLPSNLSIFPNLQIISLSLNFLTTLEPFQDCHQLQELHLRKNNIRNLNEIKYLKDLKKLTTFLLTDNPCCETTESYRLKVIRALKNLKYLDSVVISEDERAEANNEMQLELIEFERRLEQEQSGVIGEYNNGAITGRCHENEESNYYGKIGTEEETRKQQSEEQEEIGKEIVLEFQDPKIVTPLLPSEALPEAPPLCGVSGLSGDLQTYSNTLLATKLLLLDMSSDEVRQLMAWCQTKLSEST
jgi:hypothetical protein